MRSHTKAALILVMLGLVGLIGFRLLQPLLTEKEQVASSDARAVKGKILVGVDNWIGYFPLCSPEMRKRMRHAGYNFQCEDDNADYPGRMARLAKDDLQFAVATVDSYLVNGRKVKFPGTIIAVIDESKGGDAIVAWQDRAKNLDKLKQGSGLTIAFTQDSPSHHLLKSAAVHFDIPALQRGSAAFRHTEGSSQALQWLLERKTDVAVLWEPDVTKALQQPGVVKLLGTEDTDKLIVDVLIVNRKYSLSQPEAAETVLRNYFLTLKHYRSNPQQLAEDIAKATDIKPEQLQPLLKGVSWVNLNDNAKAWLGVSGFGGKGNEGLIDAIEGAVQILLDSGDFQSNPIPDEDPYRITNSQFIADLHGQTAGMTQFGHTVSLDTPDDKTANPLERTFTPLLAAQWERLREVGTLKIRPIVFQSGTSDLTFEGKQQLDTAVENLRHYPNFRIVIKGHTGLRGSADENKLLSRERAEAVGRYLQVTYGIDANRLRPVGHGSEQPLPRLPGESSRAYGYRLPRVELFLVAEDI